MLFGMATIMFCEAPSVKIFLVITTWPLLLITLKPYVPAGIPLTASVISLLPFTKAENCLVLPSN